MFSRLWRAWRKFWDGCEPLPSDVMVGSPLRPATDAERAELLARLMGDLTE